MFIRDKIILDKILHAFDEKGYRFFDSKKIFNLNIIGVRSDYMMSNKFDDMILFVYRDEKKEMVLECFVATTDPGKYWLKNPMTQKGTAILVPGQYRGMWKLGKHRGKYEALVQNSPVKVYRDNNKDYDLDMNKCDIEVGTFGINMHRSDPYKESYLVGKWSAGCQVFAKIDEYKEAMKIVKKSAKLYGDTFTYTLLNEEDLI